MNRSCLLGLFFLVGCYSCNQAPDDVRTDARFRLVPSEESGLDFSNTLSPSEDWNIID